MYSWFLGHCNYFFRATNKKTKYKTRKKQKQKNRSTGYQSATIISGIGFSTFPSNTVFLPAHANIDDQKGARSKHQSINFCTRWLLDVKQSKFLHIPTQKNRLQWPWLNTDQLNRCSSPLTINDFKPGIQACTGNNTAATVFVFVVVLAHLQLTPHPKLPQNDSPRKSS